MRSPRISSVRIATFSSSPATGLAKPSAPVYASRPPASSSAITRIAWIFGAPVTEPGGKLARSRSASPASGRSVPVTVETRCHTPGRGPRLGEPGHADRAVLAHAPEVVAHQVHDHHVLGAVLRGCGEGGAVVLGARALAAGGEHPGRGALDRLAHDLAAAAAQEQLRGEAAHGTPGAAHDSGVARLERARGAREQVERVALPLGFEPETQVGLEDLAGGDALAAFVDRGHVARAARWGRLERADPHRPFSHTLREPGAQQLEPGAQLGIALVGPQCLEPPAAVGVEAKQVVVEGEREVGQRRVPRRGRRHALEPCAEVVPEEAEPAASDATAVFAGVLDHRLAIEQLERILVLARHHERLRPHERPAARPVAGQPERALVAADQQAALRRRQVAVELDPHNARAIRDAHRSAPRVRGQERHGVPRRERQLGVSGDLVAVERGHHVAVERQPGRRGGRLQRRGAHGERLAA